MAVLLVVWELVTRWAASPLLFPTAMTVLAAFGRSVANGEVPGYAAQSLKVLLSGMAIGAALALVLTTLAVTTRIGAEFLETITSMFNPLPAIALMPLALLWFGLGVKSLIFVIIHSVLWPMSLNTYTGFVTVPPTLRRVGENFGEALCDHSVPVSPVRLPGMVRDPVGAARRGGSAGRRQAGTGGGQGVADGRAGDRPYQNRFEMNTDLVFAGLLTVILIGLLVENLFFKWLERKTVLRWGTSAAH